MTRFILLPYIHDTKTNKHVMISDAGMAGAIVDELNGAEGQVVDLSPVARAVMRAINDGNDPSTQVVDGEERQTSLFERSMGEQSK